MTRKALLGCWFEPFLEGRGFLWGHWALGRRFLPDWGHHAEKEILLICWLERPFHLLLLSLQKPILLSQSPLFLGSLFFYSGYRYPKW